MNLFSTKGWEDYELIDSGNGMRLERYGKYVISRPDPQAIWKPSFPHEWENSTAVFANDKWEKQHNFPEKWELGYKGLKFYARLTPFKHTGIFPEQSLNWDFIEEKIVKTHNQPKVLNLFAYTGIASLVAAKNGALVTHLDASKPSIAWAKENQGLSGLSEKPIRYILDDALAFTAREMRRGNVYDAIIMDPPVYGHGPNSEVWDFEESFPLLLQNCSRLLSKSPLFVLANAYAVSASSLMLNNLFEDYFGNRNIEYGELCLSQRNGRLLSTGIFARFS